MLNSIFLFLGGLGGWEVLLIMLVVLLLFGAKKIPELARGLGQGIREFKDASSEFKSELNKGLEDKPTNNSSNTTSSNDNTKA
jgi:sec-independent protein translocase protein TatA